MASPQSLRKPPASNGFRDGPARLDVLGLVPIVTLRCGRGIRTTCGAQKDRKISVSYQGWDLVQHAFVTWVETSAPRELETYLLSSSLRLPLNLEGNPWHEAVAIVSAARLKARQEADRYEVACEEALVRDGQPAIVTQAAGKQRLS